MSLLTSFFKIAPPKTNQSYDEELNITRKLMRHEAELGGELFGDIPRGHHREFFCLDENTWVWHEESKDELGKPLVHTTRYDIRPSGVLKAQNGHAYEEVRTEEAKHLLAAIELFQERVVKRLYEPKTSKA